MHVCAADLGTAFIAYHGQSTYESYDKFARQEAVQMKNR